MNNVSFTGSERLHGSAPSQTQTAGWRHQIRGGAPQKPLRKAAQKGAAATGQCWGLNAWFTKNCQIILKIVIINDMV